MLVVLHMKRLLQIVRIARDVGHVDKLKNFLLRVPHFAQCEAAELNRLQYRLRAVHVEAGQALFEEGQLATHIVIVEAGMVCVRHPLTKRRTPAGTAASAREEKDLALYGAHTLLGELDQPHGAKPLAKGVPLALGERHSYSAWSVSACTVLTILREELLRILTNATLNRCRRIHQRRWAEWNAHLAHGARTLAQLREGHAAQRREERVDAALRARLAERGMVPSRGGKLFGAVFDDLSGTYVTAGAARPRRRPPSRPPACRCTGMARTTTAQSGRCCTRTRRAPSGTSSSLPSSSARGC